MIRKLKRRSKRRTGWTQVRSQSSLVTKHLWSYDRSRGHPHSMAKGALVSWFRDVQRTLIRRFR